jgi:putative endonuclease
VSGLGARAEAIAAQYLEARGLEIVERNWRCRFGEIDLVARHAGVLVFVEVRARSSAAFGGAAASIDRRKQRKLAAAARQYLIRVSADTPCRFDAVLVDAKHCIDWIRDAFQDDG